MSRRSFEGLTSIIRGRLASTCCQSSPSRRVLGRRRCSPKFGARSTAASNFGSTGCRPESFTRTFGGLGGSTASRQRRRGLSRLLGPPASPRRLRPPQLSGAAATQALARRSAARRGRPRRRLRWRCHHSSPRHRPSHRTAAAASVVPRMVGLGLRRPRQHHGPRWEARSALHRCLGPCPCRPPAPPHRRGRHPRPPPEPLRQWWP